MAFSDMFGDMFGGMDFSSLYGNMATQQQQNQQQYQQMQPTTYQGQIPSQQPQPSWNNFSNFGLGSLWGGGSGQHPGLGSWLSPSYSRYEAPSSESMQEFGENQQQMQQQQMEQQQQQNQQQYQQGIEQQRQQNQYQAQMRPGGALSSGMDALTGWLQGRQQQQPQMQQAAGGVPPPPSQPWGAPPGPAARSMPQQMDRDSMLRMIQGLF